MTVSFAHARDQSDFGRLAGSAETAIVRADDRVARYRHQRAHVKK